MPQVTKANNFLVLRIELTDTDRSTVAAALPDGTPLALDKVALSVAKSRDDFVSRLPYELQMIASNLLLEAAHDASAAAQSNTLGAAFSGQIDDDLKDPEPWPEKVDIRAILRELEAELTRYVVLSAEACCAVILWITWTYVQDTFPHAPILAVVSPEKRCGKSTLLDFLQFVTYRPCPVTNLTLANLYRSIEEGYRTLILDEADTYLSRNLELIGLLNRGHARAGAYTRRQEKSGDKMVGRKFSLWAAKAIAAIGSLWHTIADRSIMLPMRPLAPGEHVQSFRSDRTEALADLRRQLFTWARDATEVVTHSNPDIPEQLNSREADSWRPLMAIADLAGPEWAQRARRSAIALRVPDAELETPGMRLLADIRTVFAKYPDCDFIPTNGLIVELCKLDESFWTSYEHGHPLTANGLSSLLRPHRIESRRHRVPGKGPLRGYFRDQFAQVFTWFLPPDANTPAPPARPVVESAEPTEPGHDHAPIDGDWGVA